MANLPVIPAYTGKHFEQLLTNVVVSEVSAARRQQMREALSMYNKLNLERIYSKVPVHKLLSCRHNLLLGYGCLLCGIPRSKAANEMSAQGFYSVPGHYRASKSYKPIVSHSTNHKHNILVSHKGTRQIWGKASEDYLCYLALVNMEPYRTEELYSKTLYSRYEIPMPFLKIGTNYMAGDFYDSQYGIIYKIVRDVQYYNETTFQRLQVWSKKMLSLGFIPKVLISKPCKLYIPAHSMGKYQVKLYEPNLLNQWMATIIDTKQKNMLSAYKSLHYFKEAWYKSWTKVEERWSLFDRDLKDYEIEYDVADIPNPFIRLKELCKNHKWDSTMAIDELLTDDLTEEELSYVTAFAEHLAEVNKELDAGSVVRDCEREWKASIRERFKSRQQFKKQFNLGDLL